MVRHQSHPRFLPKTGQIVERNFSHSRRIVAQFIGALDKVKVVACNNFLDSAGPLYDVYGVVTSNRHVTG